MIKNNSKTVASVLLSLACVSVALGEEALRSIRADAVTKPRPLSAAYPAARKGHLPLLTDAPRLDGVMGESEWNDAAVFCGFSTREAFASSATVVRAGRTATHLYAAFHCPLRPGQTELSRTTRRDGDLWQDESIEIFLDPGRTKKTYYVFILNTLGAQLDGKGYETKWNADWDAKVKVGENEWTAEVAIPFSVFGADAPKAGESWGLNFNRNEKSSGQHGSWAHLPGSAHAPQHFGAVTFATAPPLEIMAASVSRPSIGAGEWEFCVVNRGSGAVKADVVVAASAGFSSKAESLEFPLGVSTHILRCSYDREGEGTASLRLKTARGVVDSEQIQWRVVKPIHLRLELCESESFLCEKSLQMRLLTELEALAGLELKIELLQKADAKVLRTSSDVRLPAAECCVRLSVADLPAGEYGVSIQLIDSADKVVGQDSREFVRSAGPFEPKR